MIITCDICKKQFNQEPNKIDRNTKNFCSRDCYYQFKRNENIYIEKEEYTELIIKSPKFGNISVLIDKEDTEICKKYQWTVIFQKWVRDYYVTSSPNGKHISIHRLVTSCPNNLEVDHINHITRDNRKQNLKVCSHLENMQNQKHRITNTSGVPNINYDSKNNKWRARHCINKNRINVGTFNTKDEAIIALEVFKQKLLKQNNDS